MLQAGFMKCYKKGLFSVTERVYKVLQVMFIKCYRQGL